MGSRRRLRRRTDITANMPLCFAGWWSCLGACVKSKPYPPPGTYEISAHLLPNPALHTEEGAGPEIQVVISDPSSSHARGHAQAAEPLKPRKQQKPRIREIDETAHRARTTTEAPIAEGKRMSASEEQPSPQSPRPAARTEREPRGPGMSAGRRGDQTATLRGQAVKQQAPAQCK